MKHAMKLSETRAGYFPLDQDPSQLAKLLREAEGIEAKTVLSIGDLGADPQSRLTVTTRVLQVSRDRSALELGDDGALSRSPYFGKSQVEALAVLFLPRSMLLCLHSTNLEWEEDRIRLLTPWRPLKLQRRNAIRLEIPPAYEYHALYSPQGQRPLKLKILDISTLGASVHASSPEIEGLLPKGCVLQSFSFVLDGERIFVNAKVVNHIPSPALGGTRIGLKFERLRSEDTHIISAFVARYLAQYA